MAGCSHGCCSTFKEHIASVNLSPSATPSRQYKAGKEQESKNSWERGVVRDHRGMPRLDSSLEPIGVHRWASERSSFTESLRREAQTSKE